MKGNQPLLTGMVFLVALAVLLAPGVQATINTPTVSFDNTQSYTTGTSVAVGVTVSGSSSSATISRLNLKEVDGLTVSDPASGEYTNYVATTSGTTKNFVVTAGTAGTYEIKAYALEQQATTVQESTTDYITFVDPSVLRVTVDTDPDGSTYTGPDQPFNLQISIRNPLDTAVTTSLNLSFSSTAMNKSSGDPQHDTISIPAHQTVIINWSFLSETVSGTDYSLIFSIGGATAHSSTVTINAPDSGDGTTSPGGGGADTTPGAQASLSKSWSIINAGEEQLMAVDSGLIAPTQLRFRLRARANGVEITVGSLTARPATIPQAPPGHTYQYFNIDTTNINESNVESAKIRFRVTNTWMTNSSIDMNNVSLYRYTTRWEKLTTNYLNRDENHSHYEAETPGFSTFAVAGELIEGAPICTAGAKRCSENELQQCSSDGTAWEKLESCAYGCDETALACTMAPEGDRVCTPGETRCEGNVLQECKSDASAWIAQETCTYGCNSEAKACRTAPLGDYTLIIVAVIIIIVVVAAVLLYLKPWARV